MAAYRVPMKTKSSSGRAGNLRLTIACLAIAVLASFDLWAGGYCYRNRAKASVQQTGAPLVSQCGQTPLAIFPSF
jgi:hypothetical protein